MGSCVPPPCRASYRREEVGLLPPERGSQTPDSNDPSGGRLWADSLSWCLNLVLSWRLRKERAAPPNDSAPRSTPARAWENWPMVSAEGPLPGCLRWDPFGPCHLAALTAAGEARGQEPQKVFWKKIASEVLVLLCFFPSVLQSTFLCFSAQNCPLFFLSTLRQEIQVQRFNTHTHPHTCPLVL